MFPDDLKDKYKHIDSESLAGYGLLTRAKKSGWICPFCSNGTGSDGTGVDFELLNDGYKGHCFKCGQNFDVFDLIARRFNLSVKIDFAEVMKRAKEIFGDASKVQDKKPTQKVAKNYSKLLRYAIKNLDDFMKTRKTWRGLTCVILKKFGVGYLPDFIMDHTPRIIIADSTTHFLARYPFDTNDENINPKPHFGTKEIFGLKIALDELTSKTDMFIFAVEGEIDAMSIAQSGFNAIAFGGSTVSTHQKSLLKKFPQGTNFILMLDSDETGKKQAPKVAESLTECGFNVVIKFLDEKFADANAWLQVDPAGLKNELTRITVSSVEDLKKAPKNPLSPCEKKSDSVGGLVEKSEGDTTQDAIPNCPVKLFIPPNFKFRLSGIWYLTKNKKTGETSESLVSYTPTVPVKIFDKSGGDERVEIAFYNKIKNKWKHETVPQTVLAKASEITSLAGYSINVNSDTAKKFSVFMTNIQKIGVNPVNIPRVNVYEQTGWVDDSCENFIYPPGKDDYVVQNGNFDYKKKFCSRGDKADWLKLFAEVYENSIGARYAIGLACAAPLVKICGTRNFQGVLVAPSGSGKSAIAKIAVSVYGNPEELHETHNATGNFVDDLSPKFNDLFCWVDEYQSSDERLRKNFQQTIFNHAEGKTRGRLSRNADVKPQFSFRGTRLLTAEQSVLQEEFTQGAFNRLIELQANDLISDPLAVKIHQNIQKSFGHFGEKYINYISLHQKAVRQTYAELQTMLADFGDFLPAHLQQLALVYTGITYLLKMFDDAGDMKISASPSDETDGVHSPIVLLQHFDAPFFAKILPSPKESNNVARALSIISELRFTCVKRFTSESRAADNSIYWEQPSSHEPTLGIKFLNGDFGFYPYELKKLLQKQNLPPASSLMRDFAAKDLITSGNSKAHKYQLCKFVDGKSRWLYYFPAASFLENSLD